MSLTRRFFPSGWYIDALPSGEFCVLFTYSHIQTHLGNVDLPIGEAFGVLYLRCTNLPEFAFAGQPHDRNDVNFHWSLLGWQAIPTPYLGVSPVIFDRAGVYHQNDGSAGSQGYRYVAPNNALVTGDQTYFSPAMELSEWTEIVPGLCIGQGHPDWAHDAAWVWDAGTLRLLEAGRCTFIRAVADGEAVSVAFVKADGAVWYTGTLADLRALPPVVFPEPPEPTPEPPDPQDPGPDPPDPPDPPQPPPSPYNRHQEHSMPTDTLVVLRGPGGRLARPDVPHTGPWAGEPGGWRGLIFDGTNKLDARYHYRRPAAAQDALVHVELGAVIGCDATLHSGGLNQQFYQKPDGQTSQGWAEQWQFYDGNANGAIQAQVEYRPGAGGDDGPFFSYPLAVEVL